MKKTFKRTDGTEEVVEGTAEELAEYERRLRESGKLEESGPKKPGVLHGAPSVDDIPLTDSEIMTIRMLRAMPKIPDPIPWVRPHPHIYCTNCNMAPCNCYYRKDIWWKTISTDTTDRPIARFTED